MINVIDLYCERLGPGFFAEPINAATNLSFLIAAWAAWSLARRSNALSAGIWVLIGLSVTIGVGSAVFHTFATGWARVLDVLPILFFQLWFLWLYARKVVGMRSELVSTSMVGFLAAAYLGRQFPSILNGSLIYAPAFLLLLSLGLYHFQQHNRGRSLLLAATAVFSLSVVFRTIDQSTCPCFPIGTHFLWHVLNGVVIYLSMRGLILCQSKAVAFRQGA